VNRTVKIDAFPDSAFRHLERDAIVCVDIMRATTTLLTSAAQGRRTFPAASVEEALALAGRLVDPLLAGEVGGVAPEGFEMTDSPAGLARRSDTHRPLVLVSSSGTKLIINSGGGPAVYVASFRNMAATTDALVANHARVAVLGAGSMGEFRCEDQMAAAWIARRLMQRGFEPEDISTADLVKRWGEAEVFLAGWGKSAEQLRRSGQQEDLDFILSHVDDLDLVCRYRNGELRVERPAPLVKDAKPPVAAESGEPGAQAAEGSVLRFDPASRVSAFPKAI
jgi:2-phosphosulfolactate phosphatase